MNVIGVTGGYAMGKTTLAMQLHKLQRSVLYNADQAVKLLYRNPSILREIESIIPQVFDANTLNKKQLANLVFKSPLLKSNLENFFHPILEDQITNLIIKNNDKKIILDVPLLFEARFNKYCDKTITAYCSPVIQQHRAIKFRSISHEMLQSINAAQMPARLKVLKCDYTINTGQSKGAVLQHLKMLLPYL